MQFSVEKSIEILQRTPRVLSGMLRGISAEWLFENEGGQSWCAYDVVGHLIHAEKTDWIPRTEIILSTDNDKSFEPFNRFAQQEVSKEKLLEELLEEFHSWREKNIEYLLAKKLTGDDLLRKGIHPEFGEVTLSQLLATWVVHDLNHIAQISRVMARQYKEAVGPWVAYLRVLQT